jgi:hypothetical protein
VTASNRPLRRISTIISSRFDPRAAVHPTGLYKQGQTPSLRLSPYSLATSKKNLGFHPSIQVEVEIPLDDHLVLVLLVHLLVLVLVHLVVN